MNSCTTCILGTIALLLSGCHPMQPQPAPDACAPRKKAMIAVIEQLPPSCIYEESPEGFSQRLHNGIYRHDPDTHTEYLLISGDGTYGKRFFRLDASQALSVVCCNTPEEEAEQETVSLYRYNGKELDYIATYPRTFMDNLLPADLRQATVPEHP